MDAYLPWLLLKDVPGIGNLVYKRLIDHFGSPEKVLSASRESLGQIQGMTNAIIQGIQTAKSSSSVRKDIQEAASAGYQIIPLSSSKYPSLLLELPDPPPFLYVYGTLPETDFTLAVVGSRNISSYGRTATQRLCRDLVTHQIVIISGMREELIRLLMKQP